MLIRSDRRWTFATAVAGLWDTINDVEQYTSWWPWLRTFDGTALAVGEVWRCSVRPPVPYTVHFELSIDDIVPMESVTASLEGDIVGTAQIHLEPRVRGCCVHLVSDIGPSSHSLSVLSKAARPVVRFGHNWIIDTAARQFAQHAIGAR